MRPLQEVLNEVVVDHQEDTLNTSNDSFLQIPLSPDISISNISFSSFHFDPFDHHNLSGDDGEELNATGAIVTGSDQSASDSDSDNSEVEEFNGDNLNGDTVLQVDLIEQVTFILDAIKTHVCIE